MKVKTALKQSKAHARFFAVILVVLAGVAAFLPDAGAGLICIGLAALALAMEVINVVFITRKSRANPDYLEEKIQ